MRALGLMLLASAAGACGSGATGHSDASLGHDAAILADALPHVDASAGAPDVAAPDADRIDAALQPDGGTIAMDAGVDTLPTAGNPNGSCNSIPLPAETQPVDTSRPTTVVGNGAASSCTFSALSAAVTRGGIVTFDCGPGLVTISVTTSLTPPASNAYAHQPPVSTVIDGGNKITLDGGGMVRIISWDHSGSWRVNNDTLTLQHIRLAHGKTTPTMAIPPCPPSGGISNTQCSTGYDDGEGGALYVRDGMLRVIDSTFEDNQAALLGPDTGGGAIYILGTANPAYIVKSSFLNNKASNAGGVGMLWAGAFIFDSLFDGNSAVGMGANGSDPTKCTCINNGQNQTGSGGNGGAIYKDGGDGASLTICGTQVRNNSANEFGAAVFLTADGSGAKLIIEDSLMKNNASPVPFWQWCTGVSTDNPHGTGSSPSPVNSSFCTTGGSCSASCSS
jgi:hypothetical protein